MHMHLSMLMYLFDFVHISPMSLVDYLIPGLSVQRQPFGVLYYSDL
jgi:hypothetical protein